MCIWVSNDLKKYILCQVIIFLLANDVILCHSYNNSQNSKPHIQFIKLISSTKDFKSTNGFFSNLKDLIIGKDDVSLLKPNGVVAFDTANIIVLDQGLNFLIRINENGIDIEESEEQFSSLACICKNNNDIYFTDSKLNKIYRLNDGEIEELKLPNVINQPTGIAYSRKNKELFVSETGQHRVLNFDSVGNLKKIIGYRGNDSALFNYPTYLWIDKFGNLLINDAMNFRIQIFSESGDLLKVFGKQGDGSGYFASIKGIATDSYNNIYVVDAIFHTVQVFDFDGNFLYRFGSKGKNKGEFFMPTGIYIDDNDYIYVADSYNSRIQVFKLVIG